MKKKLVLSKAVLAGFLCWGAAVGVDCAAMQVRQTLLTAQTAPEFFDRLQELREGMAKNLRYEPSRLVNLNGAKETELKFGDQFKGR